MSLDCESSPTTLTPRAKRLQVGVRTGRLAKRVHHVERIFVAIEVQRLKSGTAASLEPADSRIPGRFDGGQEIFGEHAGTEDGLKSVSERGAHEFDFLFRHRSSSLSVIKSITVNTAHNTPAAIA